MPSLEGLVGCIQRYCFGHIFKPLYAHGYLGVGESFMSLAVSSPRVVTGLVGIECARVKYLKIIIIILLPDDQLIYNAFVPPPHASASHSHPPRPSGITISLVLSLAFAVPSLTSAVRSSSITCCSSTTAIPNGTTSIGAPHAETWNPLPPSEASHLVAEVVMVRVLGRKRSGAGV